MIIVNMNNTDTKQIIIPNMGHTMGNLICYYILSNTDVIHTGYQVDRNKNLVINIQTCNGLSPNVCVEEAVKKCREDVQKIKTSLINP